MANSDVGVYPKIGGTTGVGTKGIHVTENTDNIVATAGASASKYLIISADDGNGVITQYKVALLADS